MKRGKHGAPEISESDRRTILGIQKSEITEYHIYDRLSRSMKDPRNRKVIRDISGDELRHYNFWKKYTGEEVRPDILKIWRYYIISRLLGITFGVKLMEKGEENAQAVYERLSKTIPEAKTVEKEENKHEKELIGMIHEEKLRYIGSIVLGLNDALVELTGALAGLSFALQNTGLTAMAGLITGIAASLSMGASEYLSTKSEGLKSGKSPLKASVYTTVAYIFTVMFLVAPFFAFSNLFVSLAVTLLVAVAVILFFTFYVSVANDLPFRKRFAEMLVISLGVAGVSFVIGILIRLFLNIDV